MNPVGTTTKLSSLTVTGATALDGGEVRTTGTQLYTRDVTLGAGVDTTIEASSAQFVGKVKATTSGTERLDVTGGATFTGDVGEAASRLEAVWGRRYSPRWATVAGNSAEKRRRHSARRSASRGSTA